MEWLLKEDGTWRRVDDLAELRELLTSVRSRTDETRDKIARSREYIERGRQLVLLRRRVHSSTVH